MVMEKKGLLIVEIETGVAVVVLVVLMVIILSDFIQLQITFNSNKTANIYVKIVQFIYSVRVVVDIKQHKSQFKNSNNTMSEELY